MCYYRTWLSIQIAEFKNECMKLVSLSLDNPTIDKFSDKVNEVFEQNIYQCYTSFQEVAQLIVSNNELFQLIEEYKQ